MLELASGPLLIAGGQPEFIELKHLRRRIGLRVDARISLAPLEDTLIRELRKRAQEALKESMHPA